jgi:uncharacterized membrane protein
MVPARVGSDKWTAAVAGLSNDRCGPTGPRGRRWSSRASKKTPVGVVRRSLLNDTTGVSSSPPPRLIAKHRHRAHVNVLAALALGVVTGMVVPGAWGRVARLVAAWDVGAVAWIFLAWVIIFRASIDGTRHRAAAEDPGRTATWVLLISASTFSLLATGYLLKQSRRGIFHAHEPVIPLLLVAIAGAWAATHTAYTLRYAHLHYRDRGNAEGGVRFPDPLPPTYLDFAYFAFTIGMCFQVSDAAVTSREFRGAVLMHALLSFTYNTVILAVAINLLVGAIG